MPDGSQFDGPAGLRGLLLDRSDLFVGTLTQKLMTYALGRGLSITICLGCDRLSEMQPLMTTSGRRSFLE